MGLFGLYPPTLRIVGNDNIAVVLSPSAKSDFRLGQPALSVDELFPIRFQQIGVVGNSEEDIAWLVCELHFHLYQNTYRIRLDKMVYCQFDISWNRLTRLKSRDVASFIEQLWSELNEQSDEQNPPDAPTLDLTL